MNEPTPSGGEPVIPLTTTEERSLALDAARIRLAEAMRTMVLIVGPKAMPGLALGVQISVLNEYYAGKGRGR